jgi:hypothetical protein
MNPGKLRTEYVTLMCMIQVRATATTPHLLSSCTGYDYSTMRDVLTVGALVWLCVYVLLSTGFKTVFT